MTGAMERPLTARNAGPDARAGRAAGRRRPPSSSARISAQSQRSAAACTSRRASSTELIPPLLCAQMVRSPETQVDQRAIRSSGTSVPAVSPTWRLQRLQLADRPALERGIAPMPAARAGPGLGPAQLEQRRPALRLRPVALPELSFAQPFHPPPQPASRAHALAPHHPKPARILVRPGMGATDNQECFWVKLQTRSRIHNPGAFHKRSRICKQFPEDAEYPVAFPAACGVNLYSRP